MSKRSTTTRSTGASTRPAAPAPGGPAGGLTRRSSAGGTPATRPFLERHRGTILGLAVGGALVLVAAYLFIGAAQPAYACQTLLAPEPAATAGPGATPRLGQVTRDLGRAHVETGSRVRYEFCPPTSGAHYNDARFGPLPTRFYGADDRTDPQGWIHNLEHGQTVVLYRCPEGCAEPAQAALRALQAQLPASPLCGFPAASTVTVTRFDDLPTPYAAVVWGRALTLPTLDVAAITTFRQQSADRGPEPQCENAVQGAIPSPAPSTAPTPAP